ncbi:hypothetical protein K7432_000885 [Basidiobolus ranarum]|uniref:Alginate lyase domain-containing protein n=1 Tax=Basidiobolus ranarum TaxID=34480 RepID=A0ABR2X3X9_9FUNG
MHVVHSQNTIFSHVSINTQILAENKAQQEAYDQSLQDAFFTLKRLADKAVLNEAVYSVTNKSQLAPSNDPHDYLSLARYFWPNSNSPDGLPYIRRDGHINPEIELVPDYKLFRSLVREVQVLGLSYYFFDNDTYAIKAITRLRTWFLDNSTRMNPHLQFGSFIKGQVEGRRTGIIDFSPINDMFDVVPYLQSSRFWLPSDSEGFKNWLLAYVSWLDSSEHGLLERMSQNNHATYFDCQYMSIAIFLNRKDLAIKVAQNATLARIASQIALDGSQPHETARAASWFYSVFNLNGLVLLASLASRVGVDLWHYETPDGRSIRKAIDYLLPYARNPRSWPYSNIGGFNSTVIYARSLQTAYLIYQNPEYLKASNDLLAGYQTNHNFTRLFQPFKMFYQAESSASAYNLVFILVVWIATLTIFMPRFI